MAVVTEARAAAEGTGGGCITQSKNRLENVTFINLDSEERSQQSGEWEGENGESSRKHTPAPYPHPIHRCHCLSTHRLEVPITDTCTRLPSMDPKSPSWAPYSHHRVYCDLTSPSEPDVFVSPYPFSSLAHTAHSQFPHCHGSSHPNHNARPW